MQIVMHCNASINTAESVYRNTSARNETNLFSSVLERREECGRNHSRNWRKKLLPGAVEIFVNRGSKGRDPEAENEWMYGMQEVTRSQLRNTFLDKRGAL